MKKRGKILGYTLLLTLVLLLSACSGNSGAPEIDTLTDENTQLRRELDSVQEQLEAAQSEIERLEGELNTAVEAAAEVETPAPSAVLPQMDSKELLLGKWYDQVFDEEGMFSWGQVLILEADGAGTMNRIYYVPKSEAENLQEQMDLGFPLVNFDSSTGCSWSLDGDALRVVLDNGEVGNYTFSAEKQQLMLKNSNGQEQIYAKEIPTETEGYVRRSTYAEDREDKEAALREKFLGNWYFDVLVWTFNEDGTGYLDIPELGDQPATKREFTYEVFDDPADPTYLCLVMDWDNGSTSYYYPTFETDGSMTLEFIDDSEPIRLTRTFDISNCPISEEIISNGIGVLSGSIFSDLLPQ